MMDRKLMMNIITCFMLINLALLVAIYLEVDYKKSIWTEQCLEPMKAQWESVKGLYNESDQYFNPWNK